MRGKYPQEAPPCAGNEVVCNDKMTAERKDFAMMMFAMGFGLLLVVGLVVVVAILLTRSQGSNKDNLQ
jgi:hypothetical protein